MVGWGNLAQDLQNRVQVGQRLVLEGRLRMNTVARPDGVKEKRAEFTLSRLHPLAGGGGGGGGRPMAAPTPASGGSPAPRRMAEAAPAPRTAASAPPPPTWNASPLVPDLPDEDDIPF